MKFCKNLQRVADLSNPEWSPYWTDYKRLKKIIKTLSFLVPVSLESSPDKLGKKPSPVTSTSPLSFSPKKQRQGDHTSEDPSLRTPDSSDASGKHHHYPQEPDGGSNIDTIQKSPGEIQFFKLLHNQFQKAEHFFDRVIEGRVLNQRGTCPGRNANSQSK